MWVVYLIQHKNGDLYIGITSDLKRRISEHNQGQNSSTKRLEGQWELIYAEVYKSKIDAINRERMLKHHGNSKRKLYDRIKNSFLVPK